MTLTNNALGLFSKRERLKRTLYASICIAIGASILVLMVVRPVHPVSANYVSGVPAVAFICFGVFHLVSVAMRRFEPERDQRYLVNVIWTTTILVFPALVEVAIEVNSQPGGTTDAILFVLCGLAALVIAAVYKVVVAINDAELRLRERVLAVQLSEPEK